MRDSILPRAGDGLDYDVVFFDAGSEEFCSCAREKRLYYLFEGYLVSLVG